MTARKLATLLMLVLIGAGLCSCSDDDTVAVAKTPTYYKSANDVMQAFLTAYEERDFAVLEGLLHPDFTMPLSPQTQDEFPDLGLELDLALELRIAARMFAGEPVYDPQGNLVPAIVDVVFEVLELDGGWSATGPDSDFPGTIEGAFDVRVFFNRPGFTTLPVQGRIIFHMISDDIVVAGKTVTRWRMVGQRDLTEDFLKGSESASWGQVKALYR